MSQFSIPECNGPVDDNGKTISYYEWKRNGDYGHVKKVCIKRRIPCPSEREKCHLKATHLHQTVPSEKLQRSEGQLEDK